MQQPVQHQVRNSPHVPAILKLDMHLMAYDAYSAEFRPQQALIEGGCRGGFSVKELDRFIPGWRAELLRRGDNARAALSQATDAQSLDRDGGGVR